ncbi:hypothetical protein RhiJN_18255 [Ceratobasidium sp. AG-Ba]|nr:hypothetical protein RhiJN_18255 [Ceratobasidium sp. AG-Ba]
MSLVNSWEAGYTTRAVAISPDGRLVGAGCSGVVMIWDMSTGHKILGPLTGHRQIIPSIAFSPDGCTLASASWDRTIRMWDTKTGIASARPMEGHTNYVNSVKFSFDGRILVSGSHDKSIRRWDAITGQPAGNPIIASAEVLSVTISPNNKIVAGAYLDCAIRLYDLLTNEMVFECRGHTDQVHSVAFSPDGRRLASGSRDRTVRVWETSTGRETCNPLRGHTTEVVSVVFSPDGKYVASGSFDRTLRVWNVDSGTLLNSPLRGHTDGISSVAFAPDGRFLVSGSWDKVIRVWDILDSSVHEQRSKEIPEDEITSTMGPDEIVARLGTRGCADLTNQLDISTSSLYLISSGGFGDIYRCKLKDGAEVAVKTIRFYNDSLDRNPNNFKHAARELHTWSKCWHPNVQRLLGLAMFRDQIGMITKWEWNGSLPHYLEQNPKMDRCILSVQVCEGLFYLHESRVVHGDLKAANILVSEHGVPQLADFGNATLQECTLQFSTSSTNAIVSTRWAAPELFQGTTCSIPADIYALGMTILEIITGQVPWVGRSEYAIMHAVMNNRACPERPQVYIPATSTHGEALWRLLKSCWNFEPTRRPSAVDVCLLMKGITQEGLRDK